MRRRKQKIEHIKSRLGWYEFCALVRIPVTRPDEDTVTTADGRKIEALVSVELQEDFIANSGKKLEDPSALPGYKSRPGGAQNH